MRLTTVFRMVILSLAIVGCVMSVPPSLAAEARTSKERLSDKASDEQRVDNCRVPVERRGPKPRPDCPITNAKEPLGAQTTGAVPNPR